MFVDSPIFDNDKALKTNYSILDNIAFVSENLTIPVVQDYESKLGSTTKWEDAW